MIFNQSKIFAFSFILFVIATFSIISCSNTNDSNDSNAKNLKYKKDVGTSINENLAVIYLSFTHEAIYLYNQIENGTVTHDSKNITKIKNQLLDICMPLTESYRAEGLSQNDIEEIMDWQICNGALGFGLSYEEYLFLNLALEKDRLLLQKNIGNKSKRDIDNQTRKIEEKKEEVKRNLESLLLYFE